MRKTRYVKLTIVERFLMIKVIPVFGTATLSVEDVMFVIQHNCEMKKSKMLDHLNDQPREAVVKPYHLDYVLKQCEAFCNKKISQSLSDGNQRQAEDVNRFIEQYMPKKKVQKARHDALEFKCSPPLKNLKKPSDDESKT